MSPTKRILKPFPISPARLTVILVLAAVGFSCSSSRNTDVERGTDYRYREGFPEVRMTAIGTINEEGEPGIHVTADIVYGSLIYKSKNEIFRAGITIDVQILEEEKNKVVKSQRFNLSVKDKKRSIVTSQEVLTFEKHFLVDPGKYKINVSVIDRSSNKKTNRATQAVIPNPESEEPTLTSIQMLGMEMDKRRSEFVPVTTYDVAGRIDSLKFLFMVNKGLKQDTVDIRIRLVKFRSDTTPARPMSYNTPTPSSIQYKGIEYDETSEILTNIRRLTVSGSIVIEQSIPNLDRGNYRFEAFIENEDGDGEDEFYKAREFSVKSENYPALKSPEELARPLYYLMNEKKYRKLLQIEDADSLKQQIDRFWLSNIEDKNTARNVLQLYYERVEQANKQFSNFKEGWKTDTGMMYILFGPPWYVESSLDMMKWSYSYNREDPRYNFLFEMTRIKSQFYPFENYLLQRHSQYYNVEYQQRNLWLSGQILNRSI